MQEFSVRDLQSQICVFCKECSGFMTGTGQEQENSCQAGASSQGRGGKKSPREWSAGKWVELRPLGRKGDGTGGQLAER